MGEFEIPAEGLAGRQLLIRADSTPDTGAGHVMRCLALAQAWIGTGGRATLLTRCESPTLRRRVADSGAGLVELDREHPDPSDLGATLAALGRLAEDSPADPTPWLCMDGYHFDADYHRAVRSAGFPLLLIDDMARLPAYDAELVLNQNLGAEGIAYPATPHTGLLLGTRFALLRSEFLAQEGRPRMVQGSDRVRRVLVTMGGSDPGNISLRIALALGRLGPGDLEVRIVIGPSNTHRPSLEEALRRAPGSFTLVDPAEDMPGLMAWAELAVSASGITCWELALLGTPAALVVLAENQRNSAEGLASRGAAALLGEAATLDISRLADDLGRLMGDPRRLRRMADRARALVDGRGASRVVGAMSRRGARAPIGRAELSVRRTRPEDARLLWGWANDLTVRANAFNYESIPWEEHRRWFEDRLSSLGTRFWILEESGEPVGQIRYERDEGGGAAISYSVAEPHRGKGRGAHLIRSTLGLALAELGVEEVRAVTFAENEASRRAFLRAGFAESGPVEIRGRACYRYSWRPIRAGGG